MKFFCFLIDNNWLKIVRFILIGDLFWNLMGKVLVKFKLCWIVLLINLLLILFLFTNRHHDRSRVIYYRLWELFLSLRNLFILYYHLIISLRRFYIFYLCCDFIYLLLRLDCFYICCRCFWFF